MMAAITGTRALTAKVALSRIQENEAIMKEYRIVDPITAIRSIQLNQITKSPQQLLKNQF
jgi:hypothetical protein